MKNLRDLPGGAEEIHLIRIHLTEIGVVRRRNSEKVEKEKDQVESLPGDPHPRKMMTRIGIGGERMRTRVDEEKIRHGSQREAEAVVALLMVEEMTMMMTTIATTAVNTPMSMRPMRRSPKKREGLNERLLAEPGGPEALLLRAVPQDRLRQRRPVRSERCWLRRRRSRPRRGRSRR